MHWTSVFANFARFIWFLFFSVDFNEMRYFNFKWNWMGNFNIWARTGVIRKSEAPFAAGFQLQPRTEQRPCFYFVFVSVFCHHWHCLCLLSLTLSLSSLSFVFDTDFVFFVIVFVAFFSAAAQTWAALVCFFPMKMHYSRKMDQFAGSGTEILELKPKILRGGQHWKVEFILIWYNLR